MLLKYIIILSFGFILLTPEKVAAQKPPEQSFIKQFLEKDGAWLFSHTPETFKKHMKEIRPYFTKIGFKDYQEALLSRGEKEGIIYKDFCVTSVQGKGSWFVQGYLILKKPPKEPRFRAWYDVSDADLLLIPPKKELTILDLKILKPRPTESFEKVVIQFQQQSSSTQKTEMLISRVIIMSVYGVPESCSYTASQKEKTAGQLKAYTKVKNWLERDLKIINKKIKTLTAQ